MSTSKHRSAGTQTAALRRMCEKARRVLIEGLRYHEHDGHDMPKRVAREALEALGVPLTEQP